MADGHRLEKKFFGSIATAYCAIYFKLHTISQKQSE